MSTQVTFPVSDVEPAHTVEEPLSNGFVENEQFTISNGRRVKLKVEAQSKTTTRLIKFGSFYAEGNLFLASIQLAYSKHYPLRISPDHIWLVLSQGLAKHIQLNAESFRKRFVAHEGKKEIDVVNPRLEKGNPNSPWHELFDQLSHGVRAELLDDLPDVIQAEFSTTGIVEKSILQIVLLFAVNAYFDYAVSRCGIPAITLEGTTTDWQLIQSRMQKFRDYDLNWWVDDLEPIIDEFVKASQNQIDQSFWESIYKHNNQSGGPFITGWVRKLFPYFHIESYPRGNKSKEPKMMNRYDDISGNGTYTLKPNEFPAGKVEVPFNWTLSATERYQMLLHAGFCGISQDPSTLAIRPEIGWIVKEVSNPSN